MSLIHSNLLPDHRATIVATTLQQIFGTQEVSEFLLLTGGLSAASVYKIVVNDYPCILKLELPASTAATAVSPALSTAAAAGIAPKLHFQDTVNGIIISDFIENRPIRTVFTPDALVTEMAGIIKAIHSIPGDVPATNLWTTIDTIINGFLQTNMLSGPVFDECFYYYATIQQTYPCHDEDKVFSHNDLNPNNILCDGKRIWIVDWDKAFMNDRYVDLANAANFFTHTDEQERALLNTYFDEPANDAQIAQLYIMRQVCRLTYAMLMFQLAAQNKPSYFGHDQQMDGIHLKDFIALMTTGKLSLGAYEGQLMYGKALLNEAVNQMRTPRFKTSLTLLE